MNQLPESTHLPDFADLANFISQMVWVTDAAGQIEFINQRWYEYTGLDSTVPPTMETWQSVTHPEDLPRVIQLQKDSLAKKLPFEVEYRIRRKDGEYRWHLGRTIFVQSMSETSVRRFGSATDIHEQVENQKKLSQAVRSRDEFLSIASHELKTPLTSLKLQLQLRSLNLRRKKLEPFTEDNLAKLFAADLHQIDRITRLIDEMLDISRIESGKLTIHKENFSLNAMIDDVNKSFSETLKISGSTLETDEDPNLVGHWDRFRLEQVYTNLLSNAIRYGKGKPIHVRLRAEQGNSVMLSVRDQGIGIALEDQQRIFNRFERAVSSMEISGLGLGLYIAREIVVAHGGTLLLESIPGQGSIFSVKLPLAL